MKHLKKFENFEFGRFNDEDEIKDNELDNDFDDNEFNDFDGSIDTDDVCELCGASKCDCNVCDDEDAEDEEDADEENRIRRWGDEEIVEKKKINAGFQAYLDKQKAKNSKKKDDSDDKDDKKDDKKAPKGLTAKQKKLPQAMQDAILKKMKK